MNNVKTIIKSLYVEEIITVFFLLVFFFVYLIFRQPINFLNGSTLWMIPIILIFLVYKIIKGSVKLSFRGKGQENFRPLIETLNFIRLCAPIIVFISIYSSLSSIIDKINPRVVDPILIKMDEILFFGRNPVLMMEKFITSGRTAWFSIAYLSYFWYFPITFGVLFIKHKIKEFHILSLAVAIIAYLGFVGYLTMPAVGPFYAQQHIFSKNLQGQSIANFTFNLIDTYGYNKGTFPSLHAAFSLTFLLFTFKHLRKLFYIYLPLVISLLISTIYLRQHYVIDLIAGLVLSLFALYVAPKIYGWWARKKELPIFSTQVKKS